MKLDRIARIGVAAALAAVLAAFAGFAIPVLFPAFLKVDLGDAPALLMASGLGFAVGFWVELVKVLLHLVLRGGDLVSLLANLVAGVAYLLPMILVRRPQPTRRAMLAPFVLGPVVTALVMIPANALVFLPYHGIFGAKAWTMAAWTLGPFNLIKFGISSLAVYLLLPFLAPVLGSLPLGSAPASLRRAAGAKDGPA